MAENEDNGTATLERKYEELKRAQSGSDRTVTELRQVLAEKEQQYQELENKFTGKTNQEQEEYKKRAEAFARKEKALSLAIEKGINPSQVFSLLGLTDEDDESRIDVLVDMKNKLKLDAADSYAKANGRKIEFGIASPVTDYQSMITLSDQEISAMPDEQVHSIIHQEAESKKKTIGNKLRSWGKK